MIVHCINHVSNTLFAIALFIVVDKSQTVRLNSIV